MQQIQKVLTLPTPDMLKKRSVKKAFRDMLQAVFREVTQQKNVPPCPLLKTKNSIKYVIFDFGGVFVTEGLRRAREIYEKKTGLEIKKKWDTEIKPIWRAFEKAEIAEGDFWKGFTQKINDPRFDAQEFRKLMNKNQKRNEEIAKIIRKLRKKGYVTALLTNNVKEWIEDYNKIDPLEKYFDVIVSSHEVKEVKPDPRIYEIMMERLGARPEECVFIDDKERNLVTARNLGMKTILFKSEGQVEKELTAFLK